MQTENILYTNTERDECGNVLLNDVLFSGAYIFSGLIHTQHRRTSMNRIHSSNVRGLIAEIAVSAKTLCILRSKFWKSWAAATHERVFKCGAYVCFFHRQKCKSVTEKTTRKILFLQQRAHIIIERLKCLRTKSIKYYSASHIALTVFIHSLPSTFISQKYHPNQLGVCEWRMTTTFLIPVEFPHTLFPPCFVSSPSSFPALPLSVSFAFLRYNLIKYMRTKHTSSERTRETMYYLCIKYTSTSTTYIDIKQSFPRNLKMFVDTREPIHMHRLRIHVYTRGWLCSVAKYSV